MGTVLLGWELGGGLGHVHVLRQIATALAARGHTPVLVLKDLTVAQPFLERIPFRVLQAPYCYDEMPNGFRASSYADILATRGFASVDGLRMLVNAWRGLIELTKADLIVADFAPTLCLAAYGVVPSVVIGNGYYVPPNHVKDFPSFGPRFGTIISQDRLLENVQEVQRRAQRPVPDTLPAMLGGSRQFVHTIDELDIYQGQRTETMVGPLIAPSSASPAREPEAVFAYLTAEHPGTAQLLQRLGGMGLRASAYVRGASPRLKTEARRAGITVYDKPPPLDAELSKTALVIHNAGGNTALSSTMAGRPQLALPQFVEQSLTSRLLERLGVGRTLIGNFTPRELKLAITELLSSSTYRDRAMAIAKTIEARAYRGLLLDIADHCSACLT